MLFRRWRPKGTQTLCAGVVAFFTGSALIFLESGNPNSMGETPSTSSKPSQDISIESMSSFQHRKNVEAVKAGTRADAQDRAAEATRIVAEERAASEARAKVVAEARRLAEAAAAERERAAREAEAAADRERARQAVEAAAKEKLAACRRDLQCWGDENISAASIYCRRHVERLAEYEFKWTDAWYERKFSRFRWRDQSAGHITFLGDKVMFQNGFGAYRHHVYACDFDPATKAVLNVSALPGRLPDSPSHPPSSPEPTR